VIALVDYGAGNLTSVRKGFAAAGGTMFTPASPSELARASAIVVPGVGHFRATAALEDGWRDAIRGAVRGGTPLLGICLGLQWLYDGSAEAPEVAGLGAIGGLCGRLEAAPLLKVPHVGWNALHVCRPSRILEGVDDGTHVYFTHSYAPPVTGACVATTAHGGEFCAAASLERVHGVQFHPEKSGDAGLRILRNFVALAGHAV
jgi:glutamine amidotransferase